MRKLGLAAVALVLACATPRPFVFDRSKESAECVQQCQALQPDCMKSRWWWIFNPLTAIVSGPAAQAVCVAQLDQCVAACPGVADPPCTETSDCRPGHYCNMRQCVAR